MPTHQVAGWSSPASGVRTPKDLDFGSMGAQDASAVAITGGTVTGTVVAQHPIAAGYVALGTVQGDALAITAGVSAFATVAAGTGAKLPAGVAGVQALVVNGGANALLVYPATGGQIDALGANVAFSVGAGKAALFVPVSATQWYSLLGA